MFKWAIGVLTAGSAYAVGGAVACLAYALRRCRISLDLLVWVATMALLVSILLPALRHARHISP